MAGFGPSWSNGAIPLGLMDLLIASHALSEGCSLVSADQAFAQVDELTLESW